MHGQVWWSAALPRASLVLWGFPSRKLRLPLSRSAMDGPHEAARSRDQISEVAPPAASSHLGLARLLPPSSFHAPITRLRLHHQGDVCEKKGK